uniref:Uncharacterized protein n=1 Tax=Arundo donax TaxID=35708 RepID=A0A0A8ZQQ1_ARUDO
MAVKYGMVITVKYDDHPQKGFQWWTWRNFNGRILRRLGRMLRRSWI